MGKGVARGVRGCGGGGGARGQRGQTVSTSGDAGSSRPHTKRKKNLVNHVVQEKTESQGNLETYRSHAFLPASVSVQPPSWVNFLLSDLLKVLTASSTALCELIFNGKQKL